MADEGRKLAVWDNKFGYGTIFNAVLAIAVIGSIVASWGSLRTATDNSSAAITRFDTLILEIQKSNAANGERITRVEEQSKAMAASLERIERKVDTINVKGR